MSKARRLSPRENEIFKLLIAGKSRKDIKNDLCIAKSTLDWHIVHIYQKCGVSNRIELIQKHYEVRNVKNAD